MTGGALGSILAQHLHLTADERKTLLVAGAAGGMAATFNAPLASILLAVELLLFEWRPRSLVPVTAAVVVATVVRGFILGTGPIFPVVAHVTEIRWNIDLLALVIGLCGAAVAVAATRLVYFAEDMFAPAIPLDVVAGDRRRHHRRGRADPASSAGRRLRRDQRAADRPGRPGGDCRHSYREDSDLVAVVGLGHLRRCTRPGVHDRWRARCPCRTWLSTCISGILGDPGPGCRGRRRSGLATDRNRVHPRTDARLAGAVSPHHCRGHGLCRIGAAARPIGADREDRATRTPCDSRLHHRPAGDLLRRRRDAPRALRRSGGRHHHDPRHLATCRECPRRSRRPPAAGRVAGRDRRRSRGMAGLTRRPGA